ncbi:NAD-dependent epimerase/dehydratase family protein [Jannaschia sp. W003]|uniref:NAD-dependent epimerase/dehydratase family protein n=1 Tax=Jannaschia sp. W003 TaxID=2867012 RepID=UPI0021A73C47|nr:NAD-dependent epimerase/dehydratase family protein [Jannaschia sp. W003]UWQ22954.1 NAD-dependent epimerase/dehydratase family protein [Jannaschia sp. W003]
MPEHRETVVITGADGAIGTALAERLAGRYRIVGLTHEGGDGTVPCDVTDDASVRRAVETVAQRSGGRVASVVHLAGYYDFTGEDDPLYHEVNEAGTRRLLRALSAGPVEVEQFLYAGTMLVHEAGAPGERIDESAPEDPSWAYPESKARTERIICEEAGTIRPLFLHLAGLYDEETAVPTLSHQIARVYEREIKSHVYAGDAEAGQAFVHQDDMLAAFEAAIERRAALDPNEVILVGEPDAVSYEELQERLGRLIHGEDHWQTLAAPKPLAKVGAALETAAEPAIPDAFDQGQKPFIRPFMIDLASDHYALDVSKARRLLGWRPRRRIRDALPELVAALKRDPMAWYEANHITPPVWLESAAERVDDVEALRAGAEADYRRDHRQFLWAHCTNAALGAWLVVSPPMLGLDPALGWTNVVLGLLLIGAGLASCSWRLPWGRWAAAGLGVLVLFAPLVWHPGTGTGWLQGVLVGLAAMSLAVATPPAIGVSPVARRTGPTIPPGWDYSPSDWFQRIPVIALALVGLGFSYYLTAYQIEAIPGVWDPFFPASEGRDPSLNGTEDIVTSSVSEAWPVPDAGIGALTYALEIVVGLVGTARRWRTMPWLVVLFGMMIVPLGVVSIGFIIIQPIVIGTYSTLALIGAAAMVLQIPFSLDELVATGQFLVRRHRAGRPWLRVFFTGDTDEGADDMRDDDFARPPGVIVRDMLTGGMTVPWTLAASVGVGIALMVSPLWLGWQEGSLAPHAHVVGALAIVVAVSAMAPVARLARLANVALAAWLVWAPFQVDAALLPAAFAWACAVALAALAIPRGDVGGQRYGSWDRWIR